MAKNVCLCYCRVLFCCLVLDYYCFIFFYVLVILFCIFALVNQASDMTFGCPATDA
jgi:hypothetical protein